MIADQLEREYHAGSTLKASDRFNSIEAKNRQRFSE
jgi:hypothetical protein